MLINVILKLAQQLLRVVVDSMKSVVIIDVTVVVVALPFCTYYLFVY